MLLNDWEIEENDFIRQCIMRNEIHYDKKKRKYLNNYDEKISLLQIANAFKLNYNALKYELRRYNFDIKRTVQKLLIKKNLRKLAQKFGIKYTTLYMRIYRYKMPIEEALKRPVRSYKKKGDNQE